MPGAVNVESQVSVLWDQVFSATGYRLTIGTSSGSGDIVNDLDVGNVTEYDPDGLPFDETIYVTIVPYNDQGDATDCLEYEFSTESAGPPSCTQLTSPENGATEVALDSDLFWSHSEGSQIGYSINMGYTEGGTEILNNELVGNVNTYDPGILVADTQLYVQITPIGVGEAPTEGCTYSTFHTRVIDNDICALATTLSCVTSVAGSTTDATVDDSDICDVTITAPGVWYTFVGDGSNTTVSLCGSTSYDSKLTVFSGSCDDLVCVAGNDNHQGCNNSSEVSFTSLEGVEYFALVHGWADQVGSFRITLACAEPPLCPSQSITADDEWISFFELGGFSNPSGQAIYSDFTDMMIDVVAGDNCPVSITPEYAQFAYDEYFSVWADFNNDGDFDDPDEFLWSAGPATQTVSGNITIPADIANGEYLLRVSMKYNSLPNACQVFTYGEVEEYTLRVQCGSVFNTNDSGESSLRASILCAQEGDTIRFDPSLQGSSVLLTSDPIVIDKDLVIDASNLNITVYAIAVSRAFEISGGSSVTIIGLDIKGGLASSGNGIRNLGNLTLKDVEVDKHSSNSGILLVDNLGDLTLLGNCTILDP